ncbi:hypothetical protein EYF80_032142 [Liparis tanakae]|uniref:Uncharacterized protein n=1 Tax=Liparis tanakae TaxID=230148 RepID=A0A4Z2GWP6_9TELE|nr:hypothetical protein EYF80_032142 [Liparis tanakae]
MANKGGVDVMGGGTNTSSESTRLCTRFIPNVIVAKGRGVALAGPSLGLSGSCFVTCHGATSNDGHLGRALPSLSRCDGRHTPRLDPAPLAARRCEQTAPRLDYA